jgi:RNA polymerase sigma factor (sigma-70 family)
MINSTIVDDRPRREAAATEIFFQSPNEESFTELFLTLTPQLVSFFRSHGCARDLSDDLSQEVMLTVYRKAEQLRDRTRFRAWLFTIARHALYRHHRKHFLEVVAIDLQDIADTRTTVMAHSAFEFHHWMTFLESKEREALTLRFVEEWEYHEIATANATPIGTVQWRVFNAKKKLAALLKGPGLPRRNAAWSTERKGRNTHAHNHEALYKRSVR